MTRTHGTLARWNEDRGFGFITPAQGGAELFVHVSAFPRDGVPPAVGELVSFESETAADGKRRAVRVMRPGTGKPLPRRSAAERTVAPFSPLRAVAALLVVAAAGAYAWSHFGGPTAEPAFVEAGALGPPAPVRGGGSVAAAPMRAPVPVWAPSATLDRRPVATTSQPGFRCDGRTMCSQMTSCAEAEYFLRHCPGTGMDGNRDGEPCEQQWCN